MIRHEKTSGKGGIMRSVLTLLFCILFGVLPAVAAEKTTLKSPKDKRSYSIGLNAGRNMKQSLQSQGVDVDLKLLQKGISDGINDKKPALSDEEMQSVMTDLRKEMTAKQQEMAAKQQEKMKEQGEKNKKEGAVFLEENKKKEG
jgi:FKBP-type peptidyl-prolyl cis-trans isomerase